jgi:uncharacterized repeat protein (TIGR01451 family)
MYSVVAVGFNATDLNGNTTIGPITASTENTGGGLISFVGTGRFDANATLDFPTTVPVGTPSNVFLAGTFVFAPLAAPTISKAFGAPAIDIGGTTTLTFSIANPAANPALANISFTDTLPAGLAVATPSGLPNGTCGGSISAAAGTITVSGVTLASGASCTFLVNVSGAGAGTQVNTTSTITAVGAGTTVTGLTASATIVVRPIIDTFGAYQLRYFANLPFADSAVNITNAGTFNGIDPDGRICANVYVFDADEELISCCACPITPNGLVALSGRSDLIIKPLTPATPPSITVKLLFTVPTPIGSSTCNASSPSAATLVRGGLAWGITAHQVGTTIIPPTPPAAAGPFGLTETPFSPSDLSLSELNKLVTFCRFIQLNGSGFGICNSCRQSLALGAEQK